MVKKRIPEVRDIHSPPGPNIPPTRSSDTPKPSSGTPRPAVTAPPTSHPLPGSHIPPSPCPPPPTASGSPSPHLPPPHPATVKLVKLRLPSPSQKPETRKRKLKSITNLNTSDPHTMSLVLTKILVQEVVKSSRDRPCILSSNAVGHISFSFASYTTTSPMSSSFPSS